MLRMLQVRVGSLILTLVGATLVTFLLMHAIPGGPFAQLDGSGRALSKELVEQIERQYGLDKPLWQQYLIFAGNLLRGDLGRSLADNESVVTLVSYGLPASARLGGMAIVVAILVGIPLGLLAAVRRNSFWDYLTTVISIVGVCLPGFVLGLLLIMLLSLKLKLLPVAGWGTWQHMVIPVIALSMEPIALFTRYTRASVLEVLGELYITVARSKGLANRVVLFKHVLKNAMIPVVTVIGIVIPSLLIGSFLIETVFAIPGTGRTFVTSITRRDYPMILGMSVLYTTLVTCVNLLIDLAYLYLDPRIRYS